MHLEAIYPIVYTLTILELEFLNAFLCNLLNLRVMIPESRMRTYSGSIRREHKLTVSPLPPTSRCAFFSSRIAVLCSSERWFVSVLVVIRDAEGAGTSMSFGICSSKVRCFLPTLPSLPLSHPLCLPLSPSPLAFLFLLRFCLLWVLLKSVIYTSGIKWVIYIHPNSLFWS